MNPKYAEEIALNELYWQTKGKKGRFANLHKANLRFANLIGADLGHPLPSRSQLLAVLQEHTQSEQFDQSDWCGTNCCLAGRAGLEVQNQSAGVAVIAIVLPEFDLDVLYQTDPVVAKTELEKVKNG